MRKIPIMDIVTFAGIGAFAVIVTVVALITKQDWDIGGMVCLGAADLAVLGICTAVFVGKWKKPWEYLTAQGCYCWTDDVSEVKGKTGRERVSRALEFFCTRLPEIVCELFATECNVDSNGQRISEKDCITEQRIRQMLFGVDIDWRNSGITWVGIGWVVKDKNGLQQDKAIVVRWFAGGGVGDTAFYHELGHMVDQWIRGKLVADYEHKDVTWWKCIDKVNAEFSTIEKG